MNKQKSFRIKFKEAQFKQGLQKQGAGKGQIFRKYLGYRN